MADLRVMFPVVGINGSDEGMDLVDVAWFANSCNVILDVAREFILELSIESSIAPSDFEGDWLKTDNIFSNFLVITHFELFKLICSIGFNVEWAEIGLEF